MTADAAADTAEPPSSSWIARYTWAPLVALALLAGIVLFVRLGSQSLDDWDEAIYAQISHEILERGDWVTLHWDGRPYLRKPPLYMWSTAVLYSVFGESEFWARAASALSGIGVVLVTMLIGQRLYGRTVGIAGALVLLTSYQFVSSSRFGTTDVMLTLQFLVALYAYLRVQDGADRWWLLIWLACALAFMIKSAAGLLAPLAVFAVLTLDGGLRRSLRSRFFWTGALVAALIVVPWHVWMLWQHGAAFIDQYVGHSIVERATGVIDGHEGGRLYYVQRLYSYFYPWVLLVPFAMAVVTSDVLTGDVRARALLVASLLIFGLFTLAETKLRWYIVPLHPLLAIAVARLLSTATDRERLPIALSAALVAYGALVLTAPYRTALLVLAAGAVLLPLLLWRRRFVALGVALVFGLVAAGGLKGFYRGGESPVARLAGIAGEDVRAGDPPLIAYHGIHRPAALFYARHPIDVVGHNEQLETRLRPGETRRILLHRQDMAALSDRYSFSVLAEEWQLVYADVSIPPTAVADDEP